MQNYVASMNIDVIGCYEVNPRRSKWQREHGVYPADRKTFRVCIPKEDVKRFLDPQRWPAHIAISQWRFKKATNVAPAQVTVVQTTTNQQSLLSNVQATNVSTRNFLSNMAHSIANVFTPATLQSADPAAGPVTSAGIRQSTPNQSAAASAVTEPADMDATIIAVEHGNAV